MTRNLRYNNLNFLIAQQNVIYNVTEILKFAYEKNGKTCMK